MAKAKRTQKLKVYSTPIGFHDALVAAPSQKAALEAWGAGTNLFSQGSAEIVTDPKLTKAPLANPGQVVKVLRGSHSEQLAALKTQERPKRSNKSEPEVLPTRVRKPARKPSRAKLTRAEDALEKLNTRHEDSIARIEKDIRDLEKQRSELQRRNERERDKARERVEEEQDSYQAAIERYESG